MRPINLCRLIRKHRDDGYTLTEMLVVIGIIGVIAAFLTPSLIGQMERARTKAAHLQLETVASALELFQSDVGRYPTQGEGLAALVQAPPGAEAWSGPYLKDRKFLKDPWGAAITYRPSADGRTFALSASKPQVKLDGEEPHDARARGGP